MDYNYHASKKLMMFNFDRNYAYKSGQEMAQLYVPVDITQDEIHRIESKLLDNMCPSCDAKLRLSYHCCDKWTCMRCPNRHVHFDVFKMYDIDYDSDD